MTQKPGLLSEGPQRVPAELTVGAYLSFLLPRLSSDRSSPIWPPDVFALSMALLCKSGTYCALLEQWPSNKRSSPISKFASWADGIAALGKQWRVTWPKSVPDVVKDRWDKIATAWDSSISKLAGDPLVIQSLLELAAAADEASEGFWLPGSPGTPGTTTSLKEELQFFEHGNNLLSQPGLASTLCEEISSTRMCVLPKCRTPQNGLTSRSLSHHLALCSADEIKPRWIIGGYGNADELSLNLLLIPWPQTVTPVQFQPTTSGEIGKLNAPPFGFFTFRHLDTDPDTIVRLVEDLHKAAKDKMGSVDGVVLPEAALTFEQHDRLSEAVLRKGSFLISGVAKNSGSVDSLGENLLCIDFPTLKPLVQHKHHRWKLDQSQISQYGLGSRLYPERFWWEHISLDHRQLSFVAVCPWLVMSVLICEDLARPDPVGDLVRAVGPNLVISLLMDGPQLKDRWGARYATTLADDPGSSVLTLTSSGMAGLSRPRDGMSRSRVVALWKDAQSGAPIELEMPAGDDGLVLSLSVRYLREWTADGRRDRRNAGYPILSGIHYVRRASK